jgi:hypothetical protein
MAFLLRTVSHSAEGREIVRPARVEGDRLTVGRDPASDVHLTDLAVALRHFTVERSAGQLKVRVEDGLTVELNGRKANSGIIELATGGDILIASHVLRFLPTPAGSDEIAVNVERTTEGEVKLDKGAESRFALAGVLPSKRLAAWVGALLVLALALAWPIKTYYAREKQQAVAGFHADEMWSSGKLSQAHSQLEGNCTACHAKPFEAVADTSCKACHTQVHDHADPFRLARAQPDLTRWGRVELAFKQAFGVEPSRCVDCHTEHEGPQEMPVTAQRFCADCHGGLSEKLPDTKLENAGDFGRQHPEFRPVVLTRWTGAQPRLQRLSLASAPREDSGLKFPHALHLSRTNGVAQMARRLGSPYGFGQALGCKDCHDSTPNGVRFEPVDMEQDCAMCHSLAFAREDGTLRTLRHGEPAQVVADLRDFYRGRGPALPQVMTPAARRRPGEALDLRNRVRFAEGGTGADRAIRAVFSPGGACFDCHRIDAPLGGTLAFRVHPVGFPVRYMNHGWFDHRAHATETCTSCHSAENSNLASDLLLPDLKSCRTCHAGEGAARAKVPSSCAMCHDYHMDEGAPSMVIRRRAGGKRRDQPLAKATAARAGGR